MTEKLKPGRRLKFDEPTTTITMRIPAHLKPVIHKLVTDYLGIYSMQKKIKVLTSKNKEK
jgi:hypothetical protein